MVFFPKFNSARQANAENTCFTSEKVIILRLLKRFDAYNTCFKSKTIKTNVLNLDIVM